MALELEDLTGGIIGAAIDVHRELGPGFRESVYEAALAPEHFAVVRPPHEGFLPSSLPAFLR